MNETRRVRRAGVAAATAAVIAGGGVAVGALAVAPAFSSAPAAVAPALTAQLAAIPGAAGYSDVVREVLPSVVLIKTASGLGSGVVLDRSGNIVTNAHVAGNASKFQVQVSGDSAPRTARLVGSYPAGDLAVIRVDDASGLVPAKFGDSSTAQAGDVALAVGNPLGLSGSVTSEIISATGRVVTEPGTAGSPGTTLAAIQTSAPINPGNSGGALVNSAGEVIGIPTLAATSPLGGGSVAQGIGFAIPSSQATAIASQIISSGHVTSPVSYQVTRGGAEA